MDDDLLYNGSLCKSDAARTRYFFRTKNMSAKNE